ncbi:carboxylesterase [Thozetella sp. PMI_491]|nr:carboxylesterase [Thozetella sp. PMI_491]
MDRLTIRTTPTSAEILAKRDLAMIKVEEMCRSQAQWYQTPTVAEYRRMRAEGIGFPKPASNAGARTVTFPARDGHLVELRIIRCDPSAKSVLLHFHAGGFVIGSNRSYDGYLAHLSKNLQVSAVSVEYRLAPESPYPTGPNDAVDAALFALSPEGEAALGGPLRFLAGESAGGYLATHVALTLHRDHGIDVRSKIAAVISSYAIYDISYTPSLLSHTREAVLSREGMQRFVDAAFPNVTQEERKDARFSPLYANLANMPPSLFLCGTEDPLLDDSIFMAARWSLAGNSAELCLVPNAWHAFTLIPAGEVTDEGLAEIIAFARKYMPKN